MTRIRFAVASELDAYPKTQLHLCRASVPLPTALCPASASGLGWIAGRLGSVPDQPKMTAADRAEVNLAHYRVDANVNCRKLHGVGHHAQLVQAFQKGTADQLLPPEADAALKKLFKTLVDDQAQNELLPPLVRPSIVGGLDCDELPGANGAFGQSPLTPFRSMGRLVKCSISPGCEPTPTARLCFIACVLRMDLGLSRCL